MHLIRRFIRYYRPHLVLFTLDMFCALLVSGCDLFYPAITRSIINVYIPDRNLRLVVIWCIALAGIYLLKAVLNYIIQLLRLR